MNRLLNFRVLGIILLALCASSCGTGKQVVSPLPSESDISTDSHINLEDISGLISDYSKFPDKRTSIAAFLSSDVDWSKYTYGQLKGFVNKASSDSLLRSFFIGLAEDRQEEVLDSLSNLNYSQLGEYYRTHLQEREFTRSFIREAIHTDLEEADYFVIRHLHRSFIGTDIAADIDPIWNAHRKILWPEIDSALDDCFSTEDVVIDYYTQRCFEQIKARVDELFPEIVEKCLDEVENGILDVLFVRVKVTNVPYSDRIYQIVHNYIKEEEVESAINRSVREVLSEVSYARDQAVKTLTLDPNNSYQTLSLRFVDIDYVDPDIPRKIPNMIEKMIDKTRKWQNTLSVTATALSFMPGVGKLAKGVADGADLLYGIASTAKEQRELNQFMSEFSDALYEVEMEHIAEFCTSVFQSVKREIDDSREALRMTIYEAL